MLAVAFVRSPHAHARIVSVDAAPARALPGVAAVITAHELHGWVRPLAPRLVGGGFTPTEWPALAVGEVRYCGEAVAAVVASTPYVAADARELVRVVYEPRPAVVTADDALAAGRVLVRRGGRHGDVDGVFSRAPVVLRERFTHGRVAAVPMEPRGIVADWDGDALTVWASTQVPSVLRSTLASALALEETRVRVMAPDVGGGFGLKTHVFVEDVAVAALARLLGRPVKWVEERREQLTSAAHAREQRVDVELAADGDGVVRGLRARVISDAGAYHIYPLTAALEPLGSAAILPGPYRVEAYEYEALAVATHKPPLGAYRGVGMTMGAFVMERLLDLLAARLQVDPAEIRRRNFIARDGYPFTSASGMTYDSGDYPKALRQALDAIGGVAAFRARQEKARGEGRYLGLGLGCYVEGTGVGPFESATVRIDPTGKVYVAAGACPQGQGMETIFSQVVADAWKVTPDDVVMALADTAAISIGFGTIASRSTVTLSAAIHYASEILREKVFAIAANMLECAAGDLELRNGAIGVVGVPGNEVTLASVAKAARPGWDHGRPQGMQAGLEETYYYEPPTVTWSYATHAAIVEVDVRTGRLTIEKYVVVHDCGVVVNPMLVEGQILGGTVQGLGGALLEEFAYDSEGQLLTGSFMDYLLPTASDVPDVELIHQHSPSPLNPLGVKGVGEGSAISPPVVIANAVSDALAPFKLEFNTTPIRPEQIAAVTLSAPR